MKFLTKFLCVALFATALFTACKPNEPKDPYKAMREACETKSHPDSIFIWNETLKKCVAQYIGGNKDTIFVGNCDTITFLVEKLPVIEALLLQNSEQPVKVEVIKNLLLRNADDFQYLRKVNDFINQYDRFVFKWNGHAVGAAQRGIFLSFDEWTAWGKPALTGTPHKFGTTAAERNKFVQAGIDANIFVIQHPTIEVANMQEIVDAPAQITTLLSSNDSVIVNIYGAIAVADENFAAMRAFYTAVSNPKVIFTMYGYSVMPFSDNQTLTFAEWTAWGMPTLSVNGQNKWWVPFADVQQFYDNGVLDFQINILYTTIPPREIANAADLVGTPQWVQNNFADGVIISVKFTADFDITNAHTAALQRLINQIETDSVLLETGTGQILPATDSVAIANAKILDVLHTANALKTTTIGGNKFWFINDVSFNSLLPNNQIVRVQEVNSSDLDLEKIIPNNINMNSNIDVRPFNTIIDAGWNKPINVDCANPQTYFLTYVNQQFMMNYSIPDVPYNSEPIRFSFNVMPTRYVANNSYTNSDGIDLQTLTTNIIAKLYYAQQTAGGANYRPIKKAYAPVTLNIPNIPTNCMTDDNKPIFDGIDFHLALAQGVWFSNVNSFSTAKIGYPDNSVIVDAGNCSYYLYVGVNGITAYQNDLGLSGNDMSLICTAPSGKTSYTLQTLLDNLQQQPSGAPMRVRAVKSWEARRR